MKPKNPDWRGTSFGNLVRFFMAGVFLLGFTYGLRAEIPELTSPPAGDKGLFTAGNVIYFSFDLSMGVRVCGGTWETPEYDPPYLDIKYKHSWSTFAAGGLGGCIFDSAADGFFIDTDGNLKYVKINPSSGAILKAPTLIADNMGTGGVVAAVIDGWMYVFTATKTFHSRDGEHFSAIYPPPARATAILDAVTFYPPDDAPPLPDQKSTGAIMVAYLDGDTLKAELFQIPDFGFSGSPMTLPNPLSYPGASGNLILVRSCSLIHTIPRAPTLATASHSPRCPMEWSIQWTSKPRRPIPRPSPSRPIRRSPGGSASSTST